jgi:hypothetical protein
MKPGSRGPADILPQFHHTTALSSALLHSRLPLSARTPNAHTYTLHQPPPSPRPPAHRQPHEVARDLGSLLPAARMLGELPVMMSALGEAVKEDRAAAWRVFRAFKTLYVPNKVGLRGTQGHRERWGRLAQVSWVLAA